MDDPSFAHGEGGDRIPYTDFDYEAVEFKFDGKDASLDISGLPQEDVDRGVLVVTVLLKWLWQSGMRNPEGIQIRAIILCWVFIKALRPLDLTQIAGIFGKDKQSLGRWVDDFKLAFPRIRIAHMR